MALTEAKKKANAKYDKAHYDTFLLKLRKGEKEKVMAFARAQGKSMNGFIKDLIYREMEHPK